MGLVVDSPPTGLTATAVSSSHVSLQWQDNGDDETGFEIQQHGPGGAFQTVNTTAANIRTYSASGLQPATSYTFRVRALRVVDGRRTTSDWSIEASATT